MRKKTDKFEHIRTTYKKGNNFLTFWKNGKELHIKVTKDWYVDGTEIAQFFNKRIRDWLRNNSKLVDAFQKMNGEVPIVKATRGGQGRTLISFDLLIAIAQSYNPQFAWVVSSWFKQQCLEGNIRINQLELNLEKYLQKKPKIILRKGPYLYGYLCNGILKAGDSLANSSGIHSRTNSHACSVPRLNYSYIIYMSRSHIIRFRQLLKDRFDREQYNRDHFLCSAREAKAFITRYCKLMGWHYKCLPKHKLDEYNKQL